MTQEDKELLLKDLTERLIYHVVLSFNDGEIEPIYSIRENGLKYMINDAYYVEEVKPYLFPLSSMTEEQKRECFKGTPLEIDKYGDIAVKDDLFGNSLYTDLETYLEVIDWCIKNHFDYRGLIPMGLANDATGLNIY